MQDDFGFNDNSTPMMDEDLDNDTANMDPYKYYMNMMIMWTRNIVFFMFWFFIVMGYLFMVLTAVYISWNSVSFDPIWIRMTKTYLAAIFAPFYLFYVFMKNIVLGSGYNAMKRGMGNMMPGMGRMGGMSGMGASMGSNMGQGMGSGMGSGMRNMMMTR